MCVMLSAMLSRCTFMQRPAMAGSRGAAARGMQPFHTITTIRTTAI